MIQQSGPKGLRSHRCASAVPRGFVHRPASRPIDNVAVRCYGKGEGVQYAPYQEGSWVEKPWDVCCCYSHDVSGEQALQREVVIETKPSRDGFVEYFVKNIRIG